MKDTRRVVPYTTESGLQIGIAWQPKPTASQAQCIERHTRKRPAVTKWAAVSFLAVLALFIMARHA